MTILMGMYNDDRTDVALVSDRLATPNAIGRANGIQPVPDTIKTLKINDKCAIGFAGSIPLENALLSRLLFVPMPPQDEDLLVKLASNDGKWPLHSFNSIVTAVERIMPEVIRWANPPPDVWLGVLVAGKMDKYPILAILGAESNWEARPCFTGQAYFAPFGRKDKAVKREFETLINSPGKPYGESLRAAVKYWSEPLRLDR